MLVPLLAHSGSLYLPLQMSPEIEAKVERLFIVANMPIIKRPIPINSVHKAIAKAEHKDPGLARAVSRYIDRYSGSIGATHFNLSVAVGEGTEVSDPNSRGASFQSQYRASFAGYLVVSDHIAVNIGGYSYEGIDGDEKDTFAEGSFISLGWDFLQADIGFRPHWWGPFQDSDMLMSTQAAALPSITLSNPDPFPLLNISYEVFFGQMSESDKVLSAGGDELLTGSPRLFGMHLSANPIEGMAIGFNRLVQFGGADRDGSLSGLYGALVDPDKHDNTSEERDTDFGNQVSSITTRYTFAGNFPMSLYMQYAGEDTSLTSNNTHLGNTSLMLGVHLPKLTKQLDVSFEAAEWQNAWYINHNYGDGLTHYGAVTGHWGGNYKTNEVPDLGATSFMMNLIWQVSDGRTLTVKHRQIEATTLNNSELEKAQIITAEYAQSLGAVIGGVKVSTGQNVLGESFNQVSGFIRW